MQANAMLCGVSNDGRTVSSELWTHGWAVVACCPTCGLEPGPRSWCICTCEECGMHKNGYVRCRRPGCKGGAIYGVNVAPLTWFPPPPSYTPPLRCSSPPPCTPLPQVVHETQASACCSCSRICPCTRRHRCGSCSCLGSSTRRCRCCSRRSRLSCTSSS